MGKIMIFINIFIFILYIVFWILSRNYERDLVDSLDEKQYKMKRLFPMGLYFMDKFWHGKYVAKTNFLSSKLDDSLTALFVGEKLENIKRIYRCNKLVIVLLVIFIANFMAFGSEIKANNGGELQGGNLIQRPEYNEGTKSVTLDVQVSKNNSTILEEEYVVEVEGEYYDEEEQDKLFTYAKEYIDQQILGDNESPEKVLTNMKFVKTIPKTGLVVNWETDNYELVDEEGRVHNDEITKEVLIGVTAVITYHERQEEYTSYFCVLPKEYTKEELVRKNLSNEIDRLSAKSQSEDILTLPDSIEHQKVLWAEKSDNSAAFFLLIGGLMAFALYIAMDKDLADKVKNRNTEMLLDYPEIINKFTLLVSAGMSLANAWAKISLDYKDSGKCKRYAYEEMMITYSELMIGTSEITAYESFGRRVKLLPYLRFSSLIAQNVKKGSAGLLGQLELEAAEAFEERKELAKRLGEEAGTKLLVPMMLMLLIVLAIIMVPAFLSFNF
jgi:tight adherence protein C